MAKWLLTDGSQEEVLPTNGKSFTLKEMQDLVAGGGLIEMMTLAENTILVFDEEGKNKNLTYNELATKEVVAHATIDTFGAPGTYSEYLQGPKDFIVGDALLCTMIEVGEDE